MNLKRVFIISSLLLVFQTFLIAAPKLGSTMYVSVEEVASKSKPSIWGKDSQKFKYGDPVYVNQLQGSWVLVENQKNGTTSWLKESVLTSKKISHKNRVSVNAKELALAGKGFSNPLEEKYSTHFSKNDNFDVLDKMEKISVDIDSKLLTFIKEGKLRSEESDE